MNAMGDGECSNDQDLILEKLGFCLAISFQTIMLLKMWWEQLGHCARAKRSNVKENPSDEKLMIEDIIIGASNNVCPIHDIAYSNTPTNRVNSASTARNKGPKGNSCLIS